ncbi:MAG: hypothetical protein HND53_05380 [Proteobacteria bacterium]|nr:hypothetical protein [Pseudomonadota bacterium]NOG59913.1 hypothetical protein [Pseudomonadota bacterium]
MTIKTKTDNQLKIIKSGKCKSLTNKSTIGYDILRDPKNLLFVQLISNSGGGFYSSEPVSLDEVIKILQQVKDKTQLTAKYLHKLFKGRSSNSAGFLMCVLRDMKLVKNVSGKQRHFELMEFKPILEEMKSLASPRASTKKPQISKKTRKKSTKKARSKTG